MSRTPRKADLLQVQRYVDGELSLDSRTTFEARLKEEPTLLGAVEAAREQRQLFRDDPADLVGSVGSAVSVADAVMDQVQRLPRREQLMQMVEGDELTGVASTVGRRWLIAAAVLFVVALSFGTGLVQPRGSGKAEAAENELHKLDEAYRLLQSQGKGLPAALGRQQRSGR
jgi:anti-sigma factor RsiW